MRDKFEIKKEEATALKQIDQDMVTLRNKINHLSRLYNGQSLQKINLLRQLVINAGETGDYEHDEKYDFMYPLEEDQEPTPLNIVSTNPKKTKPKAKTTKMTIK